MKYIITILDNITETSMPFNEFVIYRATHYANEQHLLIVCSQKKELPNIFIPSNLTIYYVGSNIFKIRRQLKLVIKKICDTNKPFLIHMHQPKSALLTNVASLFMNLRKKKLYTIHSTYTGYNLRNKMATLINICFSYNVTCVSNSSYKAVPSIFKCVMKGRIQAIQNGVDTERIDKILGINPTKKANNGVITFVYVARIIPIKNHSFLLNVINEIKTDKKFKFIFIGSVEQDSAILKECTEYMLDEKVEFTGLIPRNEVFKKIYNSDIYVSPSTLEGMPVSVLEAMYCKLPVILSDIPQHRELARDEDYISTVKLEKDKWISEILKYLNMKNIDRQSIGRKCKKYIVNNFSLDSMHINYTNLYNQIF